MIPLNTHVVCILFRVFKKCLLLQNVGTWSELFRGEGDT